MKRTTCNLPAQQTPSTKIFEQKPALMENIFIIFDAVQDALNYGLKLMYPKTAELSPQVQSFGGFSFVKNFPVFIA